MVNERAYAPLRVFKLKIKKYSVPSEKNLAYV